MTRELTRDEIAKLLLPHHEAGEEAHCAGCDKPKPKYAPSPCHTTLALTMALALLDLREGIAQVILDHEECFATGCDLIDDLRLAFNGPTEPKPTTEKGAPQSE